MLNHQTPLIMLRQRSKTRKEFLPISKDLSLQESNWKMEEPFQTITFKKNQPFTWFWDSEEECKSLLRPLLVKPLPWMWNHLIPSTMLRLKFKIRKGFHPINRDWFSLENSLKMEGHCQTITSKRNLLFIWCWDWEVDNDRSIYN